MGAKKSTFDELATCPVNGAGWCPYPFSVAQLKRRLKAKAAQEALEKSAANKSTVQAKPTKKTPAKAKNS